MYKKLSPIDYQNKKRRNDNWQLLDIREPWELNIAKIDNTINIPMNEVIQKLHLLNNSDPVAVICHSGIRSAKISEILLTHSFKEVANIEGGINEWSQTVDQSIPRY